MNEEEKKNIRFEFNDKVNMSPSELEKWLKTEESQEVGDGESLGHKSGRKIIEIKNKKVDELTDNDYNHMKKVNSYISRHMAQGPSGDKKNSRWRYSLMNWGCDPCKEQNC